MLHIPHGLENEWNDYIAPTTAVKHSKSDDIWLTVESKHNTYFYDFY